MKEKLDDVVLIILDHSGSMQGQPAVTARIQIQELLSELKYVQRRAKNEIRFALMTFDAHAKWVMPPTDVDQINDLNIPAIQSDQQGLYPRTSFATMLQDLEGKLTPRFLCNNCPLNSLNIVLFSDCFPSDPEPRLREMMGKLQRNPVFSDSRCNRFLVRVVLNPELMQVNYQHWFRDAFPSRKSNECEPSDFSGLVNQIIEELDDSVGVASVF